MSSQKRNSDGSNNCIPSKHRRSQIENRHFSQQKMPISTTVFNKSNMSSVEVMETPDKPDYDKKSYRVVRLENGLKALLISDPTQERASNELDDSKNDAATTSDDDEDDDEEGEDSDSEQSDDGENVSKREKRGKLAACSLCVDVGSFSDPRDVQGLAHFLGKNQILTANSIE